jgi:hypothetical protein
MTCKLKISCFLILTSFLWSCGDQEHVLFETPQPEGVKEASSFNWRYKGEYIHCTNNADKLIIGEDYMTIEHLQTMKSHRDDLDENITADRNNDKEILAYFEKKGFDVYIEADTIYANALMRDTVFRIAPKQVLKKFNHSYFLNENRGENAWTVKRVDLQKDTLLIGEIYPSDSLLTYDFAEKNEEINDEDSSTTVDYALRPNKKEFKSLLEAEEFKTCDCYYKKK